MDAQKTFPTQAVMTLLTIAVTLVVAYRGISGGLESALIETWNDVFKTLLGMVELYSEVTILWLIRTTAACSRNCLSGRLVRISDISYWSLLLLRVGDRMRVGDSRSSTPARRFHQSSDRVARSARCPALPVETIHSPQGNASAIGWRPALRSRS